MLTKKNWKTGPGDWLEEQCRLGKYKALQKLHVSEKQDIHRPEIPPPLLFNKASQRIALFFEIIIIIGIRSAVLPFYQVGFLAIVNIAL
jgi:hypothetical protein